MQNYITRRHCRTIRTLLRSCTAFLIWAMLICTGILLSVAYTVHTEVTAVSKAQEDMLNTLMWHRMATEVEFKEDKMEPVLTDSERELITRTVMAESATLEGMMAVAQVIQNRAALWDMTLQEVVMQKDQFAKPYRGDVCPEAVQAVSAVFDEGHRVFDSNVTHFHSMSVEEPYWTKNKQCIGEAGGNRFWI